MPKMKTNSCAKKRFKVTAKGKVKYKQAYSAHMMMNKPKKMKRKARGTDVMYSGDERLVLRNFLPYDRKNKRRAKRLANRPAKPAASANSTKTEA
jgi:large subunit ribosomal protein L35